MIEVRNKEILKIEKDLKEQLQRSQEKEDKPLDTSACETVDDQGGSDDITNKLVIAAGVGFSLLALGYYFMRKKQQ